MPDSSWLEWIHTKVKSLYTGPLRRVAVDTGIHSFVKSIYGCTIVKLTGDTKEHEIAGVSVEYRIDDYSAWERQRSFEGELSVMEHFSEDITNGDVVWDIGANMGTYACLAGRSAKEVSVIAFEPVPENIERLRNNLDLNGVDRIIREEALDKSRGEMGMSSEHGGNGQYALTTDNEALQVSTTDADRLVAQNIVPQPSIVKIDVEGAELRVLKGMQNVLGDVKILYLEIHPSNLEEYGGCSNEIEALIASSGFEYEKLHERGDQYFLRAERPQP